MTDLVDIEDLGRKVPIITCSRRTDVPAFYLDEYIKYFENKSVETTNPFNGAKSKISLHPKDVAAVFWWSKDFKYWIEKRDCFREYSNFFQFTITGSPAELEPKIRTSLDERLEQLKFLVENYGVLNVSLRFDPIVIYEKDKEVKDNLMHFEKIISYASGLGLTFVIFSFCKSFRKTNSNMKKFGMKIIDLSLNEKKELLERLVGITNRYNIEMRACSNPELNDIDGVSPALCLDLNLIRSVTDKYAELKKVKRKPCGQQAGCLCADSRDISDYDHKCDHGCRYCYASPIID